MFEISTVAHKGLRELTYALGGIIEEHRAALAATPVPEKIVLRPRGAQKEFTVRVEGGTYGNIYRVLGEKPVRWVQQTDFTNDEAVGYLADRLERLGVEDELYRSGATPGSTVVIGEGDGVIFDWEPTVSSAAELHLRAARHRPAALRGRPPHDDASVARPTTSAWMPRPRPAPNSRPSDSLAVTRRARSDRAHTSRRRRRPARRGEGGILVDQRRRRMAHRPHRRRAGGRARPRAPR